MAYTDAAKISDYLQRALTQDEIDMLVFIIPAIKLWIDNLTSSTFDSAVETTRYYDGGHDSVDIDPAQDITTVAYADTDSGLAPSENDYTLYQDYVLEPQNSTVKLEVVRRHGKFPSGLRRVAVAAKFTEYDYANATVPQDIILAATRIAAGLIRGSSSDASAGDIKRESLEGHSVEYMTSADSIDKIASGDPVVQGLLNQRKQILVE